MNTGRLLAEIALPANAGGAPMTYMAGGKQYVVFPEGGSNITEELISPCREERIHRTLPTPRDADPSSIVLTGSRVAI